jgi:hypothetical protein
MLLDGPLGGVALEAQRLEDRRSGHRDYGGPYAFRQPGRVTGETGLKGAPLGPITALVLPPFHRYAIEPVACVEQMAQ